VFGVEGIYYEKVLQKRSETLRERKREGGNSLSVQNGRNGLETTLDRKSETKCGQSLNRAELLPTSPQMPAREERKAAITLYRAGSIRSVPRRHTYIECSLGEAREGG